MSLLTNRLSNFYLRIRSLKANPHLKGYSLMRIDSTDADWLEALVLEIKVLEDRSETLRALEEPEVKPEPLLSTRINSHLCHTCGRYVYCCEKRPKCTNVTIKKLVEEVKGLEQCSETLQNLIDDGTIILEE